MKTFCESYTHRILILSIDLILTSSPYSYQKSRVIETGSTDFQMMTVSVMKTTYEKLKPRIVNYRDNENFCNDTFR